MPNPSILQTIEDDALYPGHVVRRMLEQAGTCVPSTAWIGTVEAAAILNLSSDYVRKRCSVWAEQKHPVVRVRKTSEADNAHWRLYDQDVYDLARRRGTPVDADDVRVELTGDEEADTIAHYCDVVTRNL